MVPEGANCWCVDKHDKEAAKAASKYALLYYPPTCPTDRVHLSLREFFSGLDLRRNQKMGDDLVTTVPAFVERRQPRQTAKPGAPPVAGATVPAFVERGNSRRTCRAWTSAVAGATVPALSDPGLGRLGPGAGRLSPGLRSQPSLSDLIAREAHLGRHGCRRYYGRLFVERTRCATPR